MWEELGIEPTADALAIKRAYAKRLKQTRPDEDAAAYQRLREAYDHALLWARHAALEDEDEDEDAFSPADGNSEQDSNESGVTLAVPARDDVDVVDALLAATADLRTPTDDGFDGQSPVATPLPIDNTPPTARADDGLDAAFDTAIDTQPALGPHDDDEDDDTPHHRTPDEIAHAIHAAWQHHGDDALVTRWPHIRDELDALPFAQRDAASAWMAHLVIDNPALPRDVVAGLAEQFQWGIDFRALRVLHPERAHTLTALLRDLGILRINDPDVLHRFRRVRQLDALRTRGRRWQALLLAVLLPERVSERWRETSDHLRSGLGIAWSVDDIDRWLQVAAVLRGLAFAALLTLLIDTMPEVTLPLAAIYAVLATVGVFIAPMIATGLQSMIDRWHAALAARWALLRAPPGHARFAVVLGTLCAATFALIQFGAFSEGRHPAPWFWLAAAALLLLWSPDARWRVMLLPVSLALYLALRPLIPAPAPMPIVALLAFAWTLAAYWFATARTRFVIELYRNPFATVHPRNAWGWIVWIVFFKAVAAMAALATVLFLPLTLMVQARGYGQRFVFATFALTIVTTLAFAANGDDVPALIILLLAPIVLAIPQWIAHAIARLRLFA